MCLTEIVFFFWCSHPVPGWLALFLLQNRAVCAPVFALCVTHALRAVSMISVVVVIATADHYCTLSNAKRVEVVSAVYSYHPHPHAQAGTKFLQSPAI